MNRNGELLQPCDLIEWSPACPTWQYGRAEGFSRPSWGLHSPSGDNGGGRLHRIEVDAMPDMQQVLVWAIVLFMLGAALLSTGLARLQGARRRVRT
ncbi:MAG: hypothetical protein OXL97_06980 [Chloroflexota bacterium]|nr:hypothetical protein [Chloroflexota bacterium]MDE2885706.1 hypothetical protein [Chloroflexota bacterium]